MTRDEMLTKLKNIKPTAFPTVATFDMGLQFDTYTSEGMGTHLGDIASWPLWKIKRLSNEKQIEVMSKIAEKKLTAEDFKHTEFETLSSELVNNKKLDLNEIFLSLEHYPYSEEKKYLYVYSDTEGWNDEVLFFDSEELLAKYFTEVYSIYSDWDDLDDSELEECINELNDHSEGLVLWEFSEKSENE